MFIIAIFMIPTFGYLQPTDDFSKGGKSQLVQSAVVAVVDEQLAMAMINFNFQMIMIAMKSLHLTGSCIRAIGGKADCAPPVAPNHWVVPNCAVQPFLIH